MNPHTRDHSFSQENRNPAREILSYRQYIIIIGQNIFTFIHSPQNPNKTSIEQSNETRKGQSILNFAFGEFIILKIVKLNLCAQSTRINHKTKKQQQQQNQGKHKI